MVSNKPAERTQGEHATPNGVACRTVSHGLFLLLVFASPALASDVWHECLTEAVPRLDDSHSDPRSVAAGINAVCEPKHRESLQGLFRNRTPPVYLSDEDVAKTTSALREEDIDYVTGLVLTWRATGRAKAHP